MAKSSKASLTRGAFCGGCPDFRGLFPIQRHTNQRAGQRPNKIIQLIFVNSARPRAPPAIIARDNEEDLSQRQNVYPASMPNAVHAPSGVMSSPCAKRFGSKT